MKLTLTTDKQYLRVLEATKYEIEKINQHFTVYVENWFIMKKKFGRNAITQERFINDYQMLPIGLWGELFKCVKANNFHLDVSDDVVRSIIDVDFSEDRFRAWVDEYFDGATNEKGEPFKPFEYQIYSAYRLLKYRNAVVEVATSGGKTLVAYILFKYWYEVLGLKNTLFMSSRVGLISQTIDKFKLYDSFLKSKPKEWVGVGIGGKPLSKKWTDERIINDTNIVFSTFQSLGNKPREFIQKFDCVFSDETHHVTAKTIQFILKSLSMAKYRVGMSGTVHKRERSINSFISQAYLGQIVYTVTAKDLIEEEKTACPIIVIQKRLDYSNIEKKNLLYQARKNRNQDDMDVANLIYKEEQRLIRSDRSRMQEIIKDINNTEHNSLVLFSDVRGGYGKTIVKELIEHTDKTVYYVDGEVDPKDRVDIIERFEGDEYNNSVIVASIGTFSEGIDLKRVWNIFLVESTKSETNIRQALGRGMRLFPGKTFVRFIDYVDNMNYNPDGDAGEKFRTCSMMKHGYERAKVYKEQGFPIHKTKTTLK